MEYSYCPKILSGWPLVISLLSPPSFPRSCFLHRRRRLTLLILSGGYIRVLLFWGLCLRKEVGGSAFFLWSRFTKVDYVSLSRQMSCMHPSTARTRRGSAPPRPHQEGAQGWTAASTSGKCLWRRSEESIVPRQKDREETQAQYALNLIHKESDLQRRWGSFTISSCCFLFFKHFIWLSAS